jgi:signal transduction histidine kinase
MLDRIQQAFGARLRSEQKVREFAADASHELRTPLTRQRTLLEVALRDRAASVETLTLACEGALRASAQQERLIAAMLTLARGERGLDRFEPFDLAAITAETVLTRQADVASGQLTVEATIGTSLALGDASLAERLVANLIDNAIRHNHANGQIQISTGTTSDGKAFITVSNTGPCVPPDQLPRLYQPFQRLDLARTGGTGLGLGLAIVQAIAAAHEAELIAQPNPEGGLTVQLRFLRADVGQRTALAVCAR